MNVTLTASPSVPRWNITVDEIEGVRDLELDFDGQKIRVRSGHLRADDDRLTVEIPEILAENDHHRVRLKGIILVVDTKDNGVKMIGRVHECTRDLFEPIEIEAEPDPPPADES